MLRHVREHSKEIHNRLSNGVGPRPRITIPPSRLADLSDFCFRNEVPEGAVVANFPDPGGHPVEGLTVYVGYRCLYDGCTYCAIKSRTMATHRSSVHKDTPPPSGPAEASTHVQTFFASPLKYFSVNVDLLHPLDATDADGRFALLLTSLDKLPEIPVGPALADRERSTVCRLTDWDKHLAGTRATAASRSQARGLIKKPGLKEEPLLFPLAAAFRAYTTRIADIASGVPVLVRRYLEAFPL